MENVNLSFYKKMNSDAIKLEIDIKEEIKIEEEEIIFGEVDNIAISETDFQDPYIGEGHKDYVDTFKGKKFSKNRCLELIEGGLTEKRDMKAFHCSNCNFIFEREDELMSHLESSCKGKVACSQYSSDGNCEESDLKTFLLLNHKNADKSNEEIKLYKCSECSYECNQKRYLKQHILKHENKFSECNYESNRKRVLKRHLITPANTKLFKCSECNYEFNHKGNFNIHLRTHTNIKLFKCSECNYESNRKYDLKIHLLTHTNIKLFKCAHCIYDCNRKDRLKKHLQSHENI